MRNSRPLFSRAAGLCQQEILPRFAQRSEARKPGPAHPAAPARSGFNAGPTSSTEGGGIDTHAESPRFSFGFCPSRAVLWQLTAHLCAGLFPDSHQDAIAAVYTKVNFIFIPAPLVLVGLSVMGKPNLRLLLIESFPHRRQMEISAGRNSDDRICAFPSQRQRLLADCIAIAAPKGAAHTNMLRQPRDHVLAIPSIRCKSRGPTHTCVAQHGQKKMRSHCVPPSICFGAVPKNRSILSDKPACITRHASRTDLLWDFHSRLVLQAPPAAAPARKILQITGFLFPQHHQNRPRINGYRPNCRNRWTASTRLKTRCVRRRCPAPKSKKSQCEG